VAILKVQQDVMLLRKRHMFIVKIHKDFVFLKQKCMWLYGGHINMSRF
jgi:hypothetical protein